MPKWFDVDHVLLWHLVFHSMFEQCWYTLVLALSNRYIVTLCVLKSKRIWCLEYCTLKRLVQLKSFTFLVIIWSKKQTKPPQKIEAFNEETMWQLEYFFQKMPQKLKNKRCAMNPNFYMEKCHGRCSWLKTNFTQCGSSWWFLDLQSITFPRESSLQLFSNVHL